MRCNIVARSSNILSSELGSSSSELGSSSSKLGSSSSELESSISELGSFSSSFMRSRIFARALRSPLLAQETRFFPRPGFLKDLRVYLSFALRSKISRKTRPLAFLASSHLAPVPASARDSSPTASSESPLKASESTNF